MGLTVLAGEAQAALRLPAVVSAHMVLQAEGAIPIWGWGETGEEVTVVMSDEKGAERARASGVADQAGRWRVRLPALPPGLAGRLMVTTDRGGRKEVADVVVGEVWLGGGQSNMVYRVDGAKVTPETLAAARAQADATAPAIRYFMTESKFAFVTDDVIGTWVVAGPGNVNHCSAVAWYFGAALHEKLRRPIGLIVSAVGGTPAEAWMPKATLDATSVGAAIWKRDREAEAKLTPEVKRDFEEKLKAWEKEPAASRGRRPSDPVTPVVRHHPCRLYEGMIAGLGDYAMKGVIWFQADGNIRNPGENGELIQAMIQRWRAQWHAELPFYYVEMNNMHPAQTQPFDPKDEAMALIREQQNAALQLPKTGVVSAIDLGRVNNPTFDAHFPVKKPVGDRLANLALTECYGFALGEVYSPTFASYRVEGEKVRLSFQHAAGLRASGDGSVKGFVLAKPDGKWVWAEGKVEGETVVLWSREAPRPLEVRYGWASNPTISMENGVGLPLRPFRVKIQEFETPK